MICSLPCLAKPGNHRVIAAAVFVSRRAPERYGTGVCELIEAGVMKLTQAELSHPADPALLILISLADGPKHGYGIMKEVATRADVHLRTGTVYETLARLQAGGLIEALPYDGRRRPYQLTETGVGSLREQLLRVDRLVTTALRQLPGSTSGVQPSSDVRIDSA